MKTLWAPWRMEHVSGSALNPSTCFFEPPGEMRSDKSHLLLFRDRLCVVLLNRYPYANGHLLVAPRRHVADLTELDKDEQAALMSMLTKSCAILRQALRPQGINIGLNLGECAGAGFASHLHFHIVPRWDGDHNFMAVCAEIRTIPQHIEQTFDLLAEAFKEHYNNE